MLHLIKSDGLDLTPVKAEDLRARERHHGDASGRLAASPSVAVGSRAAIAALHVDTMTRRGCGCNDNHPTDSAMSEG